MTFHTSTRPGQILAYATLIIGMVSAGHAMGQAGVAATTIRNHLAKERPIRR